MGRVALLRWLCPRRAGPGQRRPAGAAAVRELHIKVQPRPSSPPRREGRPMGMEGASIGREEGSIHRDPCREEGSIHLQGFHHA